MLCLISSLGKAYYHELVTGILLLKIALKSWQSKILFKNYFRNFNLENNIKQIKIQRKLQPTNT